MKQLIVILIMMCVLMLGCNEQSSNSSGDVPNPNAPPDSSQAWKIITPAGITVIGERSTIAQYESLWGDWGNIDWLTLDELFGYYKDYYCYQLGWNCKDSSPTQLTVHIKPWDGRCEDQEDPAHPKEIYAYLNGQYMCVDGWYHGRTIYIHLGDDPGYDHSVIFGEATLDYFGFQETAYSHELLHFFQDISGLPFAENVGVVYQTVTGDPLSDPGVHSADESSYPHELLDPSTGASESAFMEGVEVTYEKLK